jgi:hypothetical protein
LQGREGLQSVKHANDFRAIVSSRWYQAMFPGTRIACPSPSLEHSRHAAKFPGLRLHFNEEFKIIKL